MTPEQEQCGTCRFWRAYTAKPDKGECLRYPPQIYLEPPDWPFRDAWPETKKTEWCGEFSRKEVASE